ncbi:MAG: molybdopterin molybdenumtransferase MoeA, partial [Gemmobacter sp.]
MITVEEALGHVLALARPMPAETVALADAAGRWMAEPVAARRDQPPFDASAMDGYAVTDEAPLGATYHVVGEAGAGHGFGGRINAGEALRIFTGAPVPEGAQRVVLQENVRRDGAQITIIEASA